MENFATELLFVIFALILVSVLAWLVIKAMKAMQVGSNKSGARIKVLSTMPVGTRERILIIQYNDNEYMLGVTSGGISLLDKYPAPAKNPTSD